MPDRNKDIEELTRLLHDRDTPLVPELEQYLEDTGNFIGMVLKHPLVFQVPFHSAALANRQLEYKRKALHKALADEKWMTAVWIHERPYRILVLQEFAEDMDDHIFWEVLGAIWTDSENIWQNDAEWRELWASDRPGREFSMDEDDRAALQDLPDTITVYRGCIAEENEDGLSWTTEERVATFFAKRFAELRNGEALVLCGEVSKEDVLAYTQGRGEYEVIVLPEKVNVTHAKVPK